MVFLELLELLHENLLKYLHECRLVVGDSFLLDGGLDCNSEASLFDNTIHVQSENKLD